MHSCYSRQSEWVEFQAKCSYCLTSRWQYWTTGNLFPLPQLVSPIQDQVSALPLRPPKPSPAALISTHAGSGQRKLQWNRLTSPSIFLRGFFISTPWALDPTGVSRLPEEPYLIGMCSVLVLGAIGGIRESLVASFVLTDVRFLSSVRSQVCFQVFESRVGLCATFKLRTTGKSGWPHTMTTSASHLLQVNERRTFGGSAAFQNQGTKVH